ncbi:MAG: hypothetical protein WAT92_19305 [Saprospiraceae bacterium]
MKKIIIFLLYGLVQSSCNSPSDKSDQPIKINVDSIENDDIIFDIDSSKWYAQKPSELLVMLKLLGQPPQFKESEIVGLFTYNKSPVINYPSIMIVNKHIASEPPSLSQLERELGAMTITLEEIEKQNKMKLGEFIGGLDFKTPILIKDKQLILTETTAQILKNQTLKIRQAIFYRGKSIMTIQFSYIEGRDNDHLKDYNRIVESIQF